MRLKISHLILLALLGILTISQVSSNDNGDYLVGVGIADVTGPAAELGMMGYANPSQSAQGIHTRLFSRAFIFKSDNQSAPVVFVSADIGMVDQALKIKVVEKLQEKYGPFTFTAKNVLLSGTHTHSGPGAFLQYLMYGITSLGFMESSFNAIVNGMVQSIERAHANIVPGKLFINSGKVQGANINRSPTSYLANPEAEREIYKEDGDVDKTMVLVRIETSDGKPLGAINWFAVHPTSMNNTNRLLSGDNKGYAGMLFEYAMNPGERPGKGKFVAAFASSNLGDVSPNTRGPRCIDTGEPCDNEASTCGKYVQKCIAFGPGKDMKESTKIIGKRQFDVAFELYHNSTSAVQLKGDVKFIHQYVNMSEYEVDIVNPITNVTTKKKTCPAAMGYSFAAGTTDGPGMFDFVQGATSGNVFWDAIRNLLQRPSPEVMDCQSPKPILLAVGESHLPYEWVPSIVETQVLKIGNLFIIGIPGELTTMSGRRLRAAVQKAVTDNQPGISPHVVVAGLSNVYTHYISTPEEYAKQRYEAASTLYGPNTLPAYLQQYSMLTKNMLSGGNLAAGPSPPNLLDRQWSLIKPIVMDTPPLLKSMGDVLTEPVPEVSPGETVKVVFAGGHPRHNPMREGTFLIVEKDVNTTRWKTVATDADWSTTFHWSRPRFMSSESRIEITWEVPDDVEPGFYRIRHFGYYKPASESEPRPYQGTTAVFKVAGLGSQSMTHPDWSSQQRKPSNILSVRQLWQALGSVIKGR